MPNPVVHFEMNGPDGGALARFYSELFGWHVQEVPGSGYWIVDTHAGSGINGGFGTTQDGGAYGTFYVESPEPEALMKKAEEAGAKVVMPITTMTEPFPLTYGQFADPDGIVVGIVGASDQEAPGVSAGDNPPVDWFEILGSGSERTQIFYQEVLDWTFEDEGSERYRMVRHEHDAEGRDVQIGGGLGAGEGDDRWATVYARVPDVEATLAKADSLGGKRVYGPMDTGAIVSAAFRDPAGNVFGVYQLK
jgi:predicted enzyme related to lactoylglutathione lyase